MRGEHRYEISLEAWASGSKAYDADALAELPSVMAAFGALGPVVSIGGLAGGPGADFGVIVPEGGMVEEMSEAARSGLNAFTQACEKIGIAYGGIARCEVMSESYRDRDLEREPEGLLGVTEVAEQLGVSRQRLSELRTRKDFPAPIAEIAAGPVWTRTSLRRFVESWERRPGRPPRREVAG